MSSSINLTERGWQVVPGYTDETTLSLSLVEEMRAHPEAPGESSWGTRNILHAFILSTRPKIVLEIGGHIGSGSLVIGSALKANNYGHCYTLEPAPHYFGLLQSFIEKAGLHNCQSVANEVR